MARQFLSAQWRYLLMINYEIDPEVLQPLVPRGTELDQWQGKSFISMVGFRFLNTRVLGMAIPFHVNFDEINLRFYVRRQTAEGVRRGVVFIKEIVPRWAIATVARWVYNEQYVSRSMQSTVTLPKEDGTGGFVDYRWKDQGRWNFISARFGGNPVLPEQGSEEEFITEHYWGYVSQRDGSTVEYQVAHPQWQVWQARVPQFECGVEGFYGQQFATALGGNPTSAFVAEGSAIEVFKGDVLK